MTSDSPMQRITWDSLAGGFALALALAGCDAAPSAASDDPAHNDPFRDGPEWVYERAIRIGQREGGGITFASIVDMDVDSRGRIFVADELERNVRVFNESGELLETIGKTGQGPGEFQWPLAIEITAGDTLRVFDPRLWRVSVFDSADSFIRSYQVAPQAEFGQPYEFRFSEDGALHQLGYADFQKALEANLEGHRRGLVRGRNTIERWDQTRGAWVEMLTIPGIEVFVDLSEGIVQDAPFAKRPLWSVTSTGGIWHADSGEKQIYQYLRDGTHILSLQLGFAGATVTEGDEQKYRNADDLTGASDDRLREIRASRRHVMIPESKPSIVQIVVARDNSVWVQKYVDTQAEVVQWRVLRAGTGFVANVDLPSRFTPMVVSDSLLVGREEDELGVDYVTILRRSGQRER